MELGWILSSELGKILAIGPLLPSEVKFVFYYWQIAKLSMIPVSCLLEVALDKIRYSRDTKLSIGVVLLGVGVCTVTDVSVNMKGFVAAVIAVWSTALQQYVSLTFHYM